MKILTNLVHSWSHSFKAMFPKAVEYNAEREDVYMDVKKMKDNLRGYVF